MKLSCGYFTIDTKTLNSKTKSFVYSGQICVDGVETFLVRKDHQSQNIRYFPYHKREHIYQDVIDEFGDTLDQTIDKLVIEKSEEIKAKKKDLYRLRKIDRDKLKSKKKSV